MNKRYDTDAAGQLLIICHDLNTFMAYGNEVHLCGQDQHGNPVHIIFDSYELLEWLDITQVKEKVVQYINEK